MERQSGSSESLNLLKKARFLQQNKCNTPQTKRKGMARWHRTVCENLVNQNVLVPKEEQSSDSDSGSFTASQQKKRGLGHKMKFFLGKIIQSKVKEHQSMKLSNASSSQNCSPMASPKEHRQHLPLTRQTAKGSRRRISQAAILQLDVNVVEAETEKLMTDNLIVRSKRMTRRVSVTSLPTGLQKGSYSSKKRYFVLMRRKKKAVEKVKQQSEYTVHGLQMQVDDLIETIAEKSSKLLEQRHEELRQCQSLGDEILQCSKQFQRISKKNTRKYKFKNVCFPCICCCY
ncbi:putative uncharacterized protein C3orf49 homolog [Rana temporaria]|uniref:putative uncharacterized protein C3orf49 homolog n=1 Tax=Rana temporaria TaxID=8407 RepID=UPI001AADA978|nr:putative uncharacterized protein C3orf49 homolog [Rana temporaria]